MVTTSHISSIAALAAAFAAVALALPTEGRAYGWPVKPFHIQHPVRGFFGDPRISDGGHNRGFHFGVDVSARNETAVYATLTGRAYVENFEAVSVVGARGVSFSYWHVTPSIRSGHYVTAYRTIIGRVLKPNGHVHFAEAHNGVWVNPLRRGAMTPFADHTAPRVKALQVERDGRSVAKSALSKTVDLIADVIDTTPLEVPRPWSGLPVMPAVVRWRIVGVTRWQIAADFRQTIPGNELFSTYYGRWTRQNHAHRPGLYRLYLRHGWNSRAVPDGTYTVAVAAADIRGNETRYRTRVTVANHLQR